jgi:hypothetical protein
MEILDQLDQLDQLDLRGQEEIQEYQGQLAHVDIKEILAQLDKPDLLVLRELLGLMA